ncbi:hypothetical protein CK203_070263 [Vitis vinifera]|uniref:Uncharacterized protein n=1 Tax=Vitis vinifera TaxID=29760 RepID=A0A438E6S9_VITVI|nr:hypothetical protein CK203_070263 [Vitis vinifera]
MSKAWGGAGAWAADAERAEAEEREQAEERQQAAAAAAAGSQGFPSLKEAVAKPKKKRSVSWSSRWAFTPIR